MRSGIPSPSTASAFWYYDLNTKKPFRSKTLMCPPIEAPSGPAADGAPAGVRAYVFSCGSCVGAEDSPIYIETFTPEANLAGQSYAVLARRDLQGLSAAQLVARPSSRLEWVDAFSEAGAAIQAAPPCPDGKPPRSCD